MALLSEITERPISGLNHIDALIGDGHPWNFIGRDSINFSFAVGASGDPQGELLDSHTISSFNAAQQTQVRAILAYISQLTGIRFAELADSAQADMHFANADLHDDYTSQNTSSMSYASQGGLVSNLKIDAWVYLDAFEGAGDNLAPSPGGEGYETLLHELGHLLGLKHPFEGTETLQQGNQLGQDNTATTLMSFTEVGGPHTGYGLYDVAALQWLYGGDGLAGAYGVGAPGKSVVGSVQADTLRGASAADRLAGGGGNDTLDGGAGIDTALFSGPRAEYEVTTTAGSYTVRHTTGSDGTDTLIGIERLAFSDARVAIDVGGNAGMAYRLYQAAFNRAPDLGGLGYQMTALDDGLHISQVANNFLHSPEFSLTYGNLNTEEFVTQLYLNVLHRNPDASGLDYHSAHLDSGALTRADVLLQFSESGENQAALIGTIENGMLYTV